MDGKKIAWIVDEGAGRKEIEAALNAYAADPASRNAVSYCGEVLDVAEWLAERNARCLKETGKRWFLPQALVPFAYECQWTLQHNCDGYGCDYDWCYGPDGMEYVLYEDRQCREDWAEDEAAFEDRFGGF